MSTDRSVLVTAVLLLAGGCAATGSSWQDDFARLSKPAAEASAQDEGAGGESKSATAGPAGPARRRPESPNGAESDNSGRGLAALDSRLTIEEAVAEALANNRSVLQARLGALISETFEKEARAALLPTVTGTAGYRYLRTVPVISSPDLGASFATNRQEVWSFQLNANFPIYAFGRYLNGWRAAKLTRRQSEAEFDAAEADMAAAVTAAAFDLLEGIRAVDVARSNEAALEQQVKDSQALKDAGRVTNAAVLEAQVSYDVAVRGRERRESAIPILRMALNRLLGRPAHFRTEIEDRPETRAPIWQPGILEEEALARRPELRAARLAVKAAARSLKATVAQDLPELRGNVNWQTDDSPFTNPKDQTTLSLQLDIPIFLGGGRFARIRRARHQIDVARLQLRDLEDQVRTEVADAYRTVREAYRDIAVAKRSIERSEESLRIQREKYRNGRATSREVLESTSLLTSARVAHVTALYAYNVALRELHRVRGADPRDPPLFEVAQAPSAPAAANGAANSEDAK